MFFKSARRITDRLTMLHANSSYGDQYMDTSQQTPSNGYYSPEHAMNNNGITSYVPHVPGRNRQPMLPHNNDPNNPNGHHDQNSVQAPFLVDRKGTLDF